MYYISYSKVTTEAQLGLIGGTMGLLTGFSILSGVEIIYYLLRFQFLVAFKINTYRRSQKHHKKGKCCHSLILNVMI